MTMSASRYKGLAAMAGAFRDYYDQGLQNRQSDRRATRDSNISREQTEHRQGVLDESWKERETFTTPRSQWTAYNTILQENVRNYGEMIYKHEQEVMDSSAYRLATEPQRQELLQRPHAMQARLSALYREYQSPQNFERWRGSQWYPDFSSVLTAVDSTLDTPTNPTINPPPTPNENAPPVDQEPHANDDGVVLREDGTNPQVPPPIDDDDIAATVGGINVAPTVPTETRNEVSSADDAVRQGYQSIQNYVRARGSLPPNGIRALIQLSRQSGSPLPPPQGLPDDERIMLQEAIRQGMAN